MRHGPAAASKSHPFPASTLASPGTVAGLRELELCSRCSTPSQRCSQHGDPRTDQVSVEPLASDRVKKFLISTAVQPKDIVNEGKERGNKTFGQCQTGSSNEASQLLPRVTSREGALDCAKLLVKSEAGSGTVTAGTCS